MLSNLHIIHFNNFNSTIKQIKNKILQFNYDGIATGHIITENADINGCDWPYINNVFPNVSFIFSFYWLNAQK